MPGFAPVADWQSFPVEDEERVVVPCRHPTLDDVTQGRRKGQQSGFLRLGTCWIEANHAPGQVHLVPREPRDLAATPSCEVAEVQHVLVVPRKILADRLVLGLLEEPLTWRVLLQPI